MESIVVNHFDYENITSEEDMDNLFKKVRAKRATKRAKKLEKKGKTTKAAVKRAKATKLTAKRGKEKRTAVAQLKIARGVKRSTKAAKKGKTAKAARITKRATTRATRVTEKGTAAERAALAPLVPLKPVMVKMLTNKGIRVSTRDPILKIAELFYNNIVRKSNKFLGEVDFDNLEDHAIGIAINAVVTAIVDFIKQSKRKRDEGKELTKTEQVLVTGVDLVQAKIEEKAREEAAQEVGQKILFDKAFQAKIGWIGAILLLLVLGGMFLRRK